MSGIAGILRFDSQGVGIQLLTAMTDSMAGRGPDGISHWFGRSVGLGHCMLRTTPESLSDAQPLTNEDESLALVLDGRIDNFKELRSDLLARGAVLRTRSDSELVLRAYETWGRDFASRLLGDFAIAIWDGRRQELVCVRDHFGACPFYYYKSESYFAFASDEEALVVLPGFDSSIREGYTASILFPLYWGTDYTRGTLEDARRLPAASILTIGGWGKPDLRIYWKLEPSEELRLGSDGEYQEAFLDVFGKSVQARLRSNKDTGIMLSGGMDSIAVAALACEGGATANNSVKTFSLMNFGDPNCSETNNIRRVNAKLGCVSHYLDPASDCHGGTFAMDEFLDHFWKNAEPGVNTIALALAMFAHAKGAGCRIMNDGIDGDLVTHAPNRYMASWIAEGDWLGAWSEVKLASKHHTYLSGNRPLSLFAKSVWDVYAPSGIVAFRRKFTHAGRRRAIGSSLIDEEFARRFCLEDKLFGLYDEMNRAENSGVQAAHIYFLTRPGLASSMDLYGSAAAPYGIESRHPWSDRRLVEFYLKLPMNQKSRAGWTKYLVRKSLDGYVDTDIVWNSRKDHLLMRMVRAIMKNSREQIEAARGSMGEVLSGIVDAKRVDALFTKDDMSNDELFDLYKLVSYQVWSKRIQAKRESPVFRKR